MSNLLKDASILLTPTGYDNGSMNAIKPENGDGDFQFSRNSAATRVNAQGLVQNVQILSSNLVQNGDFSEEGSEEIVNGDFTTDSKWSKGTGWSISGGSANCDGTQSGNTELKQQGGVLGATIDFVVGKTYKVNFDVVVTSGYITYREVASGYDNNDITTSGNHTAYITAVSTNDRFTIAVNSAFIGSIDNVSVKEVGQDWTFGTGWSVDQTNSKATCDGTQTSTSTLQTTQVISNIQNDLVKLSFEIKDYSAGAISVTLQGTGGIEFSNLAANGVYEINVTSTDPNPRLLFNANSSFVGSIANVSVIEITNDTNLPRINYEGFSYQDSLGSELVTNGDFATDSNWSKGAAWTISGGTANFDDTATSGLSQNMTFVSGKTYKISFEVISGTASIGFYSSNGATAYIGYQVYSIGTHNVNFLYSTGANLGIFGNKFAGSAFSIDNVSVKEYLGQEVVPDSGCGSWLLEPQSTNLITYSEDFSNGSWVKSNTTINLNQTTSPSGDVTADVLVGNTTNGRHGLIRGLSSNTEKGSFTLFVKKKELRFIQIASANNTNQVINFDSQLGVFGNIGAGFTNVKVTPLTNDWFKISGSTVLNSYAGFYISLVSSNTASWLESWVMPNNTDGLYIWGAQLEQQSYATSYIPTSGATSTRLKDIANNSGNASLINSSEGVLYAEISALSNDNTNRRLSLSDGTNTNRVVISYSSTNNIQIFLVNPSGNFTPSKIIDITQNAKISVLWSSTKANFYVNGVVVLETLGDFSYTANTFNTFDFNDGSGGLPFYGKNKALAVFKTALTDAQLTALTTI